MKGRCPSAELITTGTFKNALLTFRGRRYDAKATISNCNGAKTPLVLWKISKLDEARLDAFEGVPNVYTKQRIKVKLEKETVDAILYVMQPHFAVGEPTEKYLNIILNAYKEFGFDTKSLALGLWFSMQNAPTDYNERNGQTLG